MIWNPSAPGVFGVGFLNGNGLLFYTSSTTRDPGAEFTNGFIYKPGGGPFLGSSDVRMKTDIADYTKGLADVITLNPMSYRYTGKLGEQTGSAVFIGLTAQDVQKTTFSSMVSEDADGYLAIDANEITYALINAVKELTAKVEELKQEIEILKGNG
jgi:hypothetical protein